MPFPIPLGLLYTLFLIPSIVFLIIYIILEIGTIELDTEDNILSIKKPFRSYKISLSEISFIGRARRRWVIWYMYAYFAYFLYYTWYWLIGSTGYEVFNRSFKSDLLGIYLNLGMSFIMLGLLPTIGMLVLIIRPRLAVIYDGREVRFDVINRKEFLSNVFPKVEGKVIDYQPKTPLIFAGVFFLMFLLIFFGVPFGDFEISIPFIALLFGTHELISYFQNYRGEVIIAGNKVLKKDRMWVFDRDVFPSMKPRGLHILMYIALFFVILESFFSLFPLIEFPQYYTNTASTIFLFFFTLTFILAYMVWPLEFINSEIIGAKDLSIDELLNFILVRRSPMKIRQDLLPRLMFYCITFVISLIWLILAILGVMPSLQTIF